MRRLVLLPAWTGSLFFHFLVLLLMLYFFQFHAVRRSAPGERNAVGGIVLEKATETGKSYVDSQNNEFGEASPDASPNATPTLDRLLSQDLSNVDLKQSLPNPTIGPTAASGRAVQVPGSSGLASGLSGASGAFGREFGGKVKVSFFGTEGTGTRFVFVFDRSASMDEDGGRPLRAAKEQLLKSLEPLTDLHQFNIIFYNEEFIVWRQRELPFAKDQQKESAAKFVRGMTARGGTEHLKPLLEAIKLKPDVIFFLTDGEEKDERPGDLDTIRRRNPGIQINTIQFGIGSLRSDRSFLRTLATQNGGQYKYINVVELREKADEVP